MSGERLNLSCHTCFGCGKTLADEDVHTHFGLDEWGQRNGLAPLGLDLGITLCEGCTQEAPDGWLTMEAHEVSE